MNRNLENVLSYRNARELAIGYLRYEALRKLNPRQFAEICLKNLQGENFDALIDKLAGLEIDSDLEPFEPL